MQPDQLPQNRIPQQETHQGNCKGETGRVVWKSCRILSARDEVHIRYNKFYEDEISDNGKTEKYTFQTRFAHIPYTIPI